MGDRVLARGEDNRTYVVRLAEGAADIQAAQRLRFAVFNIELSEGLAQSFATGLDADPFDAVCDHLIVEETHTQEVVGTYRLQTGPSAAANRGYYSEQEFDFSPFEARRDEIVELGRACVAVDHRNLVVLSMLWRGIANYARAKGGLFLIGCSSLSSQDVQVGATAYANLQRRHLVDASWRTLPWPQLACPMEQLAEHPPKIPRLLMAYLSVGAKICGPPAIDREFKTIDFLTFLDIKTLPPLLVKRYLK